MFQRGLEYMQEVYQMYFDRWPYALLMGIVILLLATRYRKKEVAAMLVICGIIWLLFLNPIVIYLVCSLKGAVTGRYVRVFWTFPAIIAVGYLTVEMGASARKLKKVLIYGVILTIFILTGGAVLSQENFVIAPNLYKLPEEVIEVADKLEENKRAEWESPCVLVTVYLSTYIRQYDGNIRQIYGRESPNERGSSMYGKLYYYADKEIEYNDLYLLGQEAAGMGVNMMALAKYQVQSNALESTGYFLVDETENYYIYRYEW